MVHTTVSITFSFPSYLFLILLSPHPSLVREAVQRAVEEVEEKEGQAYTMQTDHNIYLRQGVTTALAFTTAHKGTLSAHNFPDRLEECPSKNKAGREINFL